MCIFVVFVLIVFMIDDEVWKRGVNILRVFLRAPELTFRTSSKQGSFASKEDQAQRNSKKA